MGFANDIKKAKSRIEACLIDKMTVVRYVDVIDTATRRKTHTQQTVCSDEPCFISYTLLNNDNPNTLNEDNLPIKWKPLVMCKLETDIKAGDEVTVSCPHRNNVTIFGKASDVCSELTHKEFNIGVNSEA